MPGAPQGVVVDEEHIRGEVMESQEDSFSPPDGWHRLEMLRHVVDAIVDRVQQFPRRPSAWISNFRLKYLSLQVDTRSGEFRILDRKGERVPLEAVLTTFGSPWRPHRDTKLIPVDPAERKVRVEWLGGHRVWDHPREPMSQEQFDALMGDIPHKDDRLSYFWTHESMYDECVEIVPWYIDPSTHNQEDDRSRNTRFSLYAEAGPPVDVSLYADGYEPAEGWNDYNRWSASHDHRLDCYADDYETLLLRLASLVEMYYDDEGEDRMDAPVECGSLDDTDENNERRDRRCTYGDDGFCMVCGYASLPGTGPWLP